MKVAEWKAKQSQPRITEDDPQIVLRRILLNSLMKATKGKGNCVSETSVWLQARGCAAGSDVVELRRGDASWRSALAQAERIGCPAALALWEAKLPSIDVSSGAPFPIRLANTFNQRRSQNE